MMVMTSMIARVDTGGYVTETVVTNALQNWTIKPVSLDESVVLVTCSAMYRQSPSTKGCSMVRTSSCVGLLIRLRDSQGERLVKTEHSHSFGETWLAPLDFKRFRFLTFECS
jgi:hypothetical protein